MFTHLFGLFFSAMSSSLLHRPETNTTLPLDDVGPRALYVSTSKQPNPPPTRCLCPDSALPGERKKIATDIAKSVWRRRRKTLPVVIDSFVRCLLSARVYNQITFCIQQQKTHSKEIRMSPLLLLVDDVFLGVRCLLKWDMGRWFFALDGDGKRRLERNRLGCVWCVRWIGSSAGWLWPAAFGRSISISSCVAHRLHRLCSSFCVRFMCIHHWRCHFFFVGEIVRDVILAVLVHQFREREREWERGYWRG